MIEIGKFTDTDEPQFTLLNDGFIPSGFVQMECRKTLPEEVGEFEDSLCIDITTDMAEKDAYDKFHFAPMTLEKDELKWFIDFLQDVYNRMK